MHIGCSLFMVMLVVVVIVCCLVMFMLKKWFGKWVWNGSRLVGLGMVVVMVISWGLLLFFLMMVLVKVCV